jgi:hypothetical protein
MSAPTDPFIQLEPGGKAPILSYNVPEPSIYSGKNYIGLMFDPTFFSAAALKVPERNSNADEDTVRRALSGGYFDKQLFPNIKIATNALAFVDRDNNGLITSERQIGASISTAISAIGNPQNVSRVFGRLDPSVVSERMKVGERLNIYRNMFGTYQYNFLPEPQKVVPRIILVETYQLSSHLGNYGAGRTIKTFTLLPGEKTTISVKTYRKTETEQKSASSILDSFTEESSSDFENSVQDEQSDKKTSAENFEYHAEADAHASWGWGSANISGGIKGGTNSSREEFGKNVKKATDKHAAKSSAKRDVHVDTSYQVKEQTGEETSIQRELQNINVSRTLNFVFRQMNQEFYTILHLVDVRVGFFNGYAESRREVSLSQLDQLLEEVIIPEKRDEVKQEIIASLQNIVDYKDTLNPFVEEVTRFNGEKSYWRVKKDMVSKYKNEATGFEVNVAGIPISATNNVMRTEGVLVEALLGQGDALDQYSHGLQDEAVLAKNLENALARARTDREKLGQTVVKAGDDTKGEIFAKVFPEPPCCCENEKVAPISASAPSTGTNGN